MTNTVSSAIIAIAYCQKYELFSATDLKDTLEYQAKQLTQEQAPIVIQIKTITNVGAATVVTQKRSIGAYVSLGGEAI